VLETGVSKFIFLNFYISETELHILLKLTYFTCIK